MRFIPKARHWWEVCRFDCEGSGTGGSPPISRVLSWAAIPLGLTLPPASSSLPGSDASHAITPLFGLAPDEVCRAVRVTTSAVSSYLTISPLPAHKRVANLGGIFLLHCLSPHGARPLAGILLYGARTFLQTMFCPAAAWRTSGADYRRYSVVAYGLALPFFSSSFGTKPNTPFLTRKAPIKSPGRGGSSSNCCNRHSLVSATYQRLPWLRMKTPGCTR